MGDPARTTRERPLHLVPPRPPRHLRPPAGPAGLARFGMRWARGSVSLGLRYPFDAVLPHRRDEAPLPADSVPDLHRPRPGDPATLQRAASGVGPLFHRRYWIDVRAPRLGPAEVLARLRDDPNHLSPSSLGRFEDADGRAVRDLGVGDELLVNLPGPWNAPVRVVDLEPTSLTLATLVGHIEAGEITFRAERRADRAGLRFEVESWARSSSVLLHLLYDVVPLAREFQLVMWARLCRAAAAFAGGDVLGDVRVRTERRDWTGRP